MAKYSEKEWRNRAAQFLRIWKKTRCAKKAIEELGTTQRIFYLTLQHSNKFLEYKNGGSKNLFITDGFSDNEYYWALRYAKKIKAVRLLGGKCIECSEDDFFKLDFHHPDNNKELSIANMRMKKWEAIKKEALKCELLCRNCHQLKHIKIDRYEKVKDKIEIIIKRL